MFPDFADAELVAQELAKHHEFRRLSTEIRKAALTQSCEADLRQAETCCNVLRTLMASPRRKGTLERTATESALLTKAVLLYARATYGTGQKGERGAISVADKLTKEQLADHDALIAVRNRSIAHVYSNESVADQVWHQGKVFLVSTENGWKPGAVKKSYHRIKPTLGQLERQVPTARAIIETLFQKRMARVTDMLNANPVPALIMKACQFDPISLFGTAMAVQQALDGIASGWASFPAAEPT